MPRDLVQLAELAQLAEGIVALLGGSECDDAVWCPLVRAQLGGDAVLADEGQLGEVVDLYSQHGSDMCEVVLSYI